MIKILLVISSTYFINWFIYNNINFNAYSYINLKIFNNILNVNRHLKITLTTLLSIPTAIILWPKNSKPWK